MNRSHNIARRWASKATLGWTETPNGKASLRRAIGKFLRMALEVRSTSLLFRGIRKVVVISPHPDDETLGCGGTIVRLVEKGIVVRVVYVTDGGGSHPGHSILGPRELAARRTAEALTATMRLGVEPGQVTFLGAKDGTMASLTSRVREDIVSRIAAILHSELPDAVFLPCGNDGSSEHDAVFRFTQEAARIHGLRIRLLEFPIWSWRNPILLLRQLLRARALWSVDVMTALPTKLSALDAYETQLNPIPPDVRSVLDAEFLREFGFSHEYFFER